MRSLGGELREPIDNRSARSAAALMHFLPDYSGRSLRDFGVGLSHEGLATSVGELFAATYGDKPVKRLVYEPLLAFQFCERFRKLHSYWDLPDPLILRALEAWRRT